MVVDGGAIDAHRETVRALAKPGQVLAPDGPSATVHNPAWFRYVAGRAIPRSGRAELHDRLIREVVESRPGVRSENRAIVLAGPPGAGKSTVLRDEILGDTPTVEYRKRSEDMPRKPLPREEWLVPSQGPASRIGAL